MIKTGYHKGFFRKLLYGNGWLGLNNADFLEELNTVADEAYSKGSIEGYMAALLIYHQITEEMIKALLEYSHFFIQCSIYPTELIFKHEKDKMFGFYLGELEKTVSFDGKDEFIVKCTELNHMRIDIVHKLTKKNSVEEIKEKMRKAKEVFDEGYEIFSNGQDWFKLCFKDFRKDLDWNIYIDEFEDEIIEIRKQLAIEKDKHLEEALQELEEIVIMLKEHYGE